MNFLYPFFLIASIAVAIPILIHLFNFRKFKKVQFPDIRFLKDIQEQTRKQSKLKHLLILASRILAILGLVIAFAQPFFNADRDKVTQGPQATSIYIDNSFSMGIENNGIPLFDLAKSKAQEIVQQGSESDQFQIISNDFGFQENKFSNKAEAIRYINQLTLSPLSKPASIVLQKQKKLLQTEHGYQKKIIFISDFQQNQFEKNIQFQDSIPVFMIPVKGNRIDNVSIDTVRFDNVTLQLNEPNVMQVVLQNRGSHEVQTTLTVTANKQLKSVTNIALQAHEKKTFPISFNTAKAGDQNLQIFIQDNPLQYDDTFYVSGKVNANYSVLVLHEQQNNAYIQAAFSTQAQFTVDNQNASTVDTKLFKNYSLLVCNSLRQLSPALNKSLTDYLQQGGNILIFAPTAGSTNGINALLSATAGCAYGDYIQQTQTLSYYNASHPIFSDLFEKTPDNIDLPIVYNRYEIKKNALSNEQKLFSFSNGDAFLSAYKVGNGSLFVCASSAQSQSSSFPQSYWFLPIMYKMTIHNQTQGIHAITLNKDAIIQVPNQKTNTQSVYHLSKQETDIIPAQQAQGNLIQLQIQQGVQQAGLYSIYLPGSTDTSWYGINYNRAESDTRYHNPDELAKTVHIKQVKWLADNIHLTQQIFEFQQGLPLWKICIMVTLLCLLIEILLIRYLP